RRRAASAAARAGARYRLRSRTRRRGRRRAICARAPAPRARRRCGSRDGEGARPCVQPTWPKLSKSPTISAQEQKRGKDMRQAAIAFAVSAFVLAAPAGAADIQYHLVGAPGVVTLVNLHPDDAHKRLSSVNYQLEGLMPACTKVKILSVTN